MASDSNRPPAEDARKKPYRRPRLETYGDIRDVASSVGHTGNADGGTHGRTKTT